MKNLMIIHPKNKINKKKNILCFSTTDNNIDYIVKELNISCNICRKYRECLNNKLMDGFYVKKKSYIKNEDLLSNFLLLEQRHLKCLGKRYSYTPADLIFIKNSLISERRTLIIKYYCLNFPTKN